MSTVQLEAARGHIRKGVINHHLHLHNIHIYKYILNRHYKRYKQIRKLQWAGLYSVVITVYMTENPYTTKPYIQKVKIFELSFFRQRVPRIFHLSYPPTLTVKLPQQHITHSYSLGQANFPPYVHSLRRHYQRTMPETPNNGGLHQHSLGASQHRWTEQGRLR